MVFGYDDAYVYFHDGRVQEAHQDENTVEYEGGKDYPVLYRRGKQDGLEKRNLRRKSL